MVFISLILGFKRIKQLVDCHFVGWIYFCDTLHAYKVNKN